MHKYLNQDQAKSNVEKTFLNTYLKVPENDHVIPYFVIYLVGFSETDLNNKWPASKGKGKSNNQQTNSQNLKRL